MSDLKLENIRKKLIGYDNESGMPFSQYVSRYNSRYDDEEDNMITFFEIITSALPDNVTLDELMFTIELVVHDLENGKCGFHNSSVTKEKFKELSDRLKMRDDLPVFLTRVPRYIEQVADKEFAQEFYQRFGKSILGEYNLEAPKEDYGYIEIRENVIDISNKDKAEVLAGLYNNSHPQGLGIAHYDPTPMTIEIAKKILEKRQDFDYLAGRPLKISLEGNEIVVAGYNHDNGHGLAQRVISNCRNINDIGKDTLKKIEVQVEEEIQKQIQAEVAKKQKEKARQSTVEKTSSHSRGGLDYLRVPQSELQPVRRLIEETGYDISEETLEFVKSVENQAYPEEMKIMQDIEDLEELEDAYNYYLSELTIARNKDWYIIYGEDEDSIEIVDIASLPNRDREASRREMHNYIVGVINRKALNGKKPVTLNAKEDTSYRMIQRMVSNGEYEIVEDTPNTWEDDEAIIMHNLVLKPVMQRDRDEI